MIALLVFWANLALKAAEGEKPQPAKAHAADRLRPFNVPSLQGLNYGGPNTLSGEWVGTEWLRSGTGVGDRWKDVRPRLEEDLTFIQGHPNLGRVQRVFVGLDQLMLWDKSTGFVRFHETCLDNFETALRMFEAHGLKVFVVLYDQEVQGSLGNFRFQALDGQHPEMRRNYLRATEIFLRRFGSSRTVVGWDLFNEAYNSLGAEGGLPRPPHENPVSPNYPTATVRDWIRDLYRAAKTAAPDAWFTVSDTTELYWHEHPDLSKYADAVDFYDIHVYDKHPKMRNWRKLLGKPVILGEVGSPERGYDDVWLNAAVANYFLEHANEGGVTTVLLHAPIHKWSRWVADGPGIPATAHPTRFVLKPRPASAGAATAAPKTQTGKPPAIDWQRAQELYDRSQRGDQLTDGEQAYLGQAKREYHKPGSPGGPPADAQAARPVSGPTASPIPPAVPQPAADEKVLFDFEDEAVLKDWSPTSLDEVREAANKAFWERLAKTKPDKVSAYRPPKPAPAAEPPVKLELSTEHATSGKHSLKLTYAGGRLPTVGTDKIAVDDWSPYKTFRADVFATRQCVVVFRVLREKSGRGDDWDDLVSRYEKVARLEPGKNEVVELTYAKGEGLGKRGKVVRLEISMYAPRPGESIWVDNIRLSTELPQATTPYSYMNVHYLGEVRAEAPFFPKLDRKIKVLGTDWELSAVPELGHRLKDQWVKPEKKTVAEIEAEFTEEYEALKKSHPRAAMAIFRDGQRGHDPAHPEKVYAGWRNTELQGHDPGGVYATYLGKHPGKSNLDTEFFLRRRTLLMKADLSSIPAGAKVLQARFMVVKTQSPDPERLKSSYAWESPLKPAFFVAEGCNRDWDEAVANGIEYAEGKFWQEICGEYWNGDDPDFFPLVIAYGQAGYDQNVFDFTQAVRYWTEGKHPNYGFTMYSFAPYMEYCKVWTRHVQDIKKRPALMVIYEPNE